VRALGLMWVLWAATSSAAPLVVIDPGHGGAQAGASSPDGLVEKNIALALARRVKGALERELKATVVLTREQDSLVLLPDRVSFANRRKPDAFVSIHANSMPTQRQRLLHEGIETYFLSAAASGEEARKVAARENAEAGGQPKGVGGDTLSFILADLQRAETHADSSRLAYAVQEALIAQTGAVNRGAHRGRLHLAPRRVEALERRRLPRAARPGHRRWADEVPPGGRRSRWTAGRLTGYGRSCVPTAAPAPSLAPSP